MKIIDKILGGRPMVKESFAFHDVVSGMRVNWYKDRLGRRWLAENKWSLFRVRPPIDLSKVDFNKRGDVWKLNSRK